MCRLRNHSRSRRLGGRSIVGDAHPTVTSTPAAGLASRLIVGTPTPFHMPIDSASGGQRSMHRAHRTHRSSSSSSAVPPATPNNEALLRCSVCAAHSKEQLSSIIDKITMIAYEAGYLEPPARVAVS